MNTMTKSILFAVILLAPVHAAAQTMVVEYYHLDALGSVRLVTDQNRTVVRQHDFFPFGEEVPPHSLGGDAHRFTGKPRDAETGLDYFGARYLFVPYGRFARADDPGYGSIFNPQSLNVYAYVLNSPLVYVDPNGNQTVFRVVIYGDLPFREELRDFWFQLGSWTRINPTVADFSAGFGDGVLLGTGGALRRFFGVDSAVNACSSAYGWGGAASFAVGTGRLTYAGAAKAGSLLANTGAKASAFRQDLKSLGRFGIGKNWRPPNLAGKSDAELRYSAGKTNRLLNAWGAGMAGHGATVALTCGASS